MDEHCWHEERIKTSMSFGTHPGNMVRWALCPTVATICACAAAHPRVHRAGVRLAPTAAPTCGEWAYVFVRTGHTLMHATHRLLPCHLRQRHAPTSAPFPRRIERSAHPDMHAPSRTHASVHPHAHVNPSNSLKTREFAGTFAAHPTCTMRVATCDLQRRARIEHAAPALPAAASAWSCSRRRRGAG